MRHCSKLAFCFCLVVGFHSTAQSVRHTAAVDECGRDASAWGPTKDGLSLGICAGQPTYKPSEPVALTFLLRNESGHEIVCTNTSLLGTYSVEVTMPDGGTAPLTLFGKRAMDSAEHSGLKTVRLKQGERHQMDLPWLNRIFDMTVPGKYRVKASRRVTNPTSRDATVELSSSELVVTVAD